MGEQIVYFINYLDLEFRDWILICTWNDFIFWVLVYVWHDLRFCNFRFWFSQFEIEKAVIINK